MKPYSNQIYGPAYIPYTIGVSGKNTFVDQKTSVYRLWPGYHTTIHVIPKLLETTAAFNALDLDTRQCKLPHENDGFQLFQEYSRVGCEIECAARKARAFCQCLPWNYPNNFTFLPMCDMFGSYCFNEIMSNIIYYKRCKSECLEDCNEASLSMWHNSVPLDAEQLCINNAYHDAFFKQNFYRMFAFESYQMLVQGQNPSDLSISLSNGSFCTKYIRKYIAFTTVESPTKTVSKSHRDQNKFFIDKLGTIGGTLGVSAGMSVISMFEVLVFFYLILNGIFHDLRYVWKKMLSYLDGNTARQEVTSDLEANFEHKIDVYADDVEDDEQQIHKIYVSINFITS